MNLLAKTGDPIEQAVSPFLEMGAYEALWMEQGETFKRIADKFKKDPQALPSDFVERGTALSTAKRVLSTFTQLGVNHFGVRIHHAGEYPKRLRDARNPVELLYYQGTWEYSEARSVAIVGSRQASEEGEQRTRQLVKHLVGEDFTIVSGLAKGIDTAAHNSALEFGGRTIGVIGTPLGHSYPSENKDLQKKIADEYLLISQVPLLRYRNQTPRTNRFFFPERNATMSALTEATIIVEASETSGTLTQARAALFQGRKLFILDSCFQRKDITWPSRFEADGAVRVRTMNDVWDNLDDA